MKRFFLAAFLFAATASAIPILPIGVTGTIGPLDWTLPEHSIDGDPSTFWHGTDDISIGTTDELVYELGGLFAISELSFFQDQHHVSIYAMGELAIQSSTDGVTWFTIDSLPGSSSFPGGNFTRSYPTGFDTSWLRLDYRSWVCSGIPRRSAARSHHRGFLF